MPIRILIVDDHSVVRQGLRMFLGLDPDLEIIGEAQDGAEALQKVRELKPDVVLMDLLMPVMDGITAIGAIRRETQDRRGDRLDERLGRRVGRRRGARGRHRLSAERYPGR